MSTSNFEFIVSKITIFWLVAWDYTLALAVRLMFMQPISTKHWASIL